MHKSTLTIDGCKFGPQLSRVARLPMLPIVTSVFHAGAINSSDRNVNEEVAIAIQTGKITLGDVETSRKRSQLWNTSVIILTWKDLTRLQGYRIRGSSWCHPFRDRQHHDITGANTFAPRVLLIGAMNVHVVDPSSARVIL